jgi:UV DNA damage repair endonuclease
MTNLKKERTHVIEYKVKAVNNHYELLKRLKFAAEWLRALGAF